MTRDYSRDRYGRKMPRRSRDKRCQDCGQSPARGIRFYSTGMPYDVCAQHEHEYCGTPKQREEHDEWGLACVVPVSWDLPVQVCDMADPVHAAIHDEMSRRHAEKVEASNGR